MRLRDIEKLAKSVGTPLDEAVSIYRKRLVRELIAWIEHSKRCSDNTWHVIVRPSMVTILGELKTLATDLSFYCKPDSDTDITPEMVKLAKAYPVQKLVDFKRGRATAWCHEDKRPSLFLAPRINKVICPACGNKKFDAIDVLVMRDGMKWADAVRRLLQ